MAVTACKASLLITFTKPKLEMNGLSLQPYLGLIPLEVPPLPTLGTMDSGLIQLSLVFSTMITTRAFSTKDGESKGASTVTLTKING
jgi:hypothetical protein